jgi:hypothetical protein
VLKDILRKGASRELLEQYGRKRRTEWEQLLGKGCLTSANAWVETYKNRLIPCLPASGNDLAEIFAHLTGELAAKH